MIAFRSIAVLVLVAAGLTAPGAAQDRAPRTVRVTAQTGPGTAPRPHDMPVLPVPTDLPLVDADAVELADDELVLGVARGETAVAFPVRFLAMYEVVNARVGDLPVAPTW